MLGCLDSAELTSWIVVGCVDSEWELGQTHGEVKRDQDPQEAGATFVSFALKKKKIEAKTRRIFIQKAFPNKRPFSLSPCSVPVLGLVAVHLLSYVCGPMGCTKLGSSIPGLPQARALERVGTSFSRGSSRPRDQARVCWIAVRSFTTEPPGKPSLRAPPKTPAHLNSFISFNQNLKPHCMNSLSSASVFLMDTVEVPYGWCGLLMTGGMDGFVDEQLCLWGKTFTCLLSFPEMPSSLSLCGLSSRLRQTPEIGSIINFRGWDLAFFVSVEGFWGALAPSNRKQWTGSEKTNSSSFLFPKMRFILATLGEFPRADGHSCDLLYFCASLQSNRHLCAGQLP